MATIVLIGTSHNYQARSKKVPQGSYDQFESVLLATCAKYAIAAIAEEFNEDALKQRGVSSSVISELCAREGLKHQFSDPGETERAELGVEDCQSLEAVGWLNREPAPITESKVRASHEKRERFWLTKIESLDVWPLLFVCGADHVDYFLALLQRSGHNVTVEFSDWEADQSDR